MDSASGRILIVDDDAALLKVLDAYLSRLGYRVDACRNSADALALVEANPAIYAGALVDVNMPGMRGRELARRILDMNASIRVVVMSGYPSGSSGETLAGQRVGFLNKPFAPKDLADAFRQDKPPASF